MITNFESKINFMKTKSFILKASVAVLTAVGLYACSSGDGGVYDYLSSDKAMYFSVNLNDVYDNAGFKVTSEGVEPSEAFKKLIDGKDEKALAVLNMRGINLDNVLIINDIENGNPVPGAVVFSIDDKEKFNSYLQDNGLTGNKDNGFDVYELDNDASIVVDGDYGLIVNRDGGAPEKVTALKDAAKKSPLKSWQKDALSKDHTLSMIMNIKDLYEMSSKNSLGEMPSLSQLGYSGDKGAYGVFTSSLSGLKWEGESSVCDADGEKVKFDIEYYPLAKSLLDYTNSKDCAVVFSAMPKNLDYTDIIKQVGGLDEAVSRQIGTVLSSIHSVMLAGGPLDITSYNQGDGWCAVLALNLASGSAQEYLNMAKVFASQAGVPLQKSENEISVSGLYGMNISLKADGDNLVLALNPPTDAKDSAFNAADFGKFGGMMLDIPANSPSTTFLSIPFGIKGRMVAEDKAKVKCCLELTDTKGKLLENIIEFAASKQ